MTERIPATWRNRIVGEGEENPSDLSEHPSNWRVHNQAQRKQMGAVLDTIGYVQPILVNRNTKTILDGHMRVALAITKGETTVPVSYVDMTAEEEHIVLATLDPLKAIAQADSSRFDGLREAVGQSNPGLAALVGWSDRHSAESSASVAGYDADDLAHLQDRSGIEADHTAIFGMVEDEETDDGALEPDDTPIPENPYTALTVRQLRFTVSKEDNLRALDVLDDIILNQPGCSNNAEAVLWMIETYGGAA